MVQARYLGLIDPKAAFDDLRPFRKRLIEMQERHRPFGPGCSLAVAQGLPWKVVPTSTSTVNILGVSLTSPLGACGPGTVPATLTASVLTFNAPLAGGCTVSGNINVSPILTITP